MKALLICAHPDDLEFSIPSIMITLGQSLENANQKQKEVHDAIQHGRALFAKDPTEVNFEIKVASMTRGEMSGFTDLVGSTLTAAKIRTRELEKSQNILIGKKPDFLGYFDGYVKISEECIQNIKNYIQGVQPDLVIAPEPWLAWYHHPDHVKTGISVYLALQHLKRELRENQNDQQYPKLYYFQSLGNDWVLPRYPAYKEKMRQAIASHASQKGILLAGAIPAFFERFVLGLRTRGYFFAEGLRYQPLFRSNKSIARKITTRFHRLHLIRRMAYYFGKNLTSKGGSYTQRYNRYYTGTLPPTIEK